MSFAQELNRIVGAKTSSSDNNEDDNNKRVRTDNRENEMNLEDYEAKILADSSRELVNTNKILVLRGFVCYLFDTVSGEWQRMPDSRRDRSYFEAVLFDDCVYAIGTYNITAAGTVERFVLSRNKWENVNPLPKRIRSVAAEVVNDSIYVTGGYDHDSKEATNSVYKLGRGETDWQLAPNNLLVPRYRHSAIVWNNKLWLIGGIIKNSYGVEEYTSTTEIMDIETSTWSVGPSLCARRAIDVSPMVLHGVLYIVGGDMKGVVHHSNACDKESADLGTIERFDAETNRFVLVKSFKLNRRGFSSCGLDGKIFVFGGRSGDQDLRHYDVFDITTTKWESDDVGKLLNNGDMPMDSLWGRAINLSTTNS